LDPIWNLKTWNHSGARGRLGAAHLVSLVNLDLCCTTKVPRLLANRLGSLGRQRTWSSSYTAARSPKQENSSDTLLSLQARARQLLDSLDNDRGFLLCSCMVDVVGIPHFHEESEPDACYLLHLNLLRRGPLQVLVKDTSWKAHDSSFLGRLRLT